MNRQHQYVETTYESVVNRFSRMFPARLVAPAVRCFCLVNQWVVAPKGSAQSRRLKRRYDAANAAYRVIENNP